jgi:hypothetical protein
VVRQYKENGEKNKRADQAGEYAQRSLAGRILIPDGFASNPSIRIDCLLVFSIVSGEDVPPVTVCDKIKECIPLRIQNSQYRFPSRIIDRSRRKTIVEIGIVG